MSQTDLPFALVRPSVAIHASGNFLVVWEGVGPAALGRVFDAAGTPKSGEIEIHRYAGGEQLLPSAAATPEGFVVACERPLGR